ncbi:biotin transporter BioY [Rhizobiaceae bacterium BDR2-2]|uniref:Biotin transporter n=1 Tax=Ectorhizobium quercum TaxID=2965071 RepID=A0AAE3N3F7_9HYPH|nr:biotin transporter BioY [Ectorhizobium quercum]MCX8996366.1 biotin transporter BioY [Ectorhizobium quercum]MCX8998595.1 biotin transporter BioY [Ectorhizobium quercum]
MNTRDLVLVSLFAAIIVALGLLPPIPLGFIPVPITAQSLGVMLAGVILGAKRGALAVALVILLVIVGLPVLSGGRGGLGVFSQPTVGFLLGWLPAAFVTGLLSQRFVNSTQGSVAQLANFFIAAVAGGVVVLYACGILGVMLVTGLPFAKAFAGSLAFIPGDLVKAGVAALAARAVQAGYPLLPVRR